MSKFAQLHIHNSDGSMLDAVATCSDYATKAVEYGHEYLAATDHGRLSAWYNLQQACNKNGLKPIFGLEQYIIPDDELVSLNDAGKRVRCKNNHIILLAKNKTGMNNILHLHYISMSDQDHFYYNNHTTFSELFKYSEGVICGTACMMSPFSNALKEGNPEKAESIFKQFLDVYKDNFYVELQINELTQKIGELEYGQRTVNDFMSCLADKYGVRKVLTGDCHYLDKEDYKIQDISLAMREKRTADQAGFTLEAKTLFYHDIDDYKFLNNQFGYGYTDDQIDEMCNNTVDIAKQCDCCINERTTMIFPNVTSNDEYEMEIISKESLAKKFGVDNYKEAPKEYSDRLDYELDLLKRKGFGSYCMVLYDIFKHCSDKYVPVGYARGCFLPGCNKVTLDKGQVNIEDVNIGDKIITGFNEKSVVDNKFIYDIDEDISIVETNDGKIKCTQDHRILIVRKGLPLKIENAEFVEASKINPGDYLIKM